MDQHEYFYPRHHHRAFFVFQDVFSPEAPLKPDHS